MRVKRWLWIIVSVAAVVFVAKYLLLDTPATPGPKFVIDVEALHKAATSSGPLPDQIEVEQVGEFSFPQKLVIAGDSFHLHPMVLLAHRVVWPNRSLIIDTAMSADAAKAVPGSRFDGAAFQRVEAALKKADAIVFTHEHSDHVGGVAAAPDFAGIAKKVRITREQLNGPKLDHGIFPK